MTGICTIMKTLAYLLLSYSVYFLRLLILSKILVVWLVRLMYAESLPNIDHELAFCAYVEIMYK